MSVIDAEAYKYVVSEFGENGYHFWRALVGKDPLFARHPSSGCKEIEITALWDSAPEGRIRVFVFCSDAGSILGQFRPEKGKSFLVCSDGTIQTEAT